MSHIEKTTRRDLLFERGNILFERTTTPDQDLEDLVCNTIFGSEGGMLYKHLDTRENIHKIEQPYFYALRHGKKLLSTITLCTRPVKQDLDRKSANAFHVRYFSFDPNMRRSNNEQKEKKKNSSILERLISAQFETKNLPLDCEGVFYAYVKADNYRSADFCERLGFSPIGSMATFIFSRIFPKDDERVEVIQESDKAKMMQLTKSFYQDYAFFSTESIPMDQNYFVLKEKGEIVAGMQVYPTTWVMEHMSGAVGKIGMKILPYIPLLSRLFNPKKYQFMASEGVFCKKGYEDRLPVLMEAICAKKKIYSISSWADVKSELYRMFKTIKNPGHLNNFNKDNEADIIIRLSSGEDSSLKETVVNSPVYISGFDIT